MYNESRYDRFMAQFMYNRILKMVSKADYKA